jgi:redox-sensitive bicupin YhaK (pirin superfamily)
MSQHPNADGSITDGVKVESWGKFVSHQLALSVAAAAQLTVPAGCNQAVVQADGGGTIAVRVTLDGTTPTTSLGFLIPAGSSITLSAADAAAAKFIGAPGATVNAVYTL